MELRLPEYEVIAEAETLPMNTELNWGISRYLKGQQRPTDGDGVLFAVFDEGVEQHIEFEDRIIYQRDFTQTGQTPETNHGTHVAGTLASSNMNIGLCPMAKIADFKVLSKNGGSLSNIEKAGYDLIDLALSMPDMIIICNMSLGAQSSSQGVIKVIAEMQKVGIHVLCASGNDRLGVDFPGNQRNVITVAAATKEEKIAEYSSRGPEVDIAAPGHEIWSTYYKDRYAVLNGSSMATPFVGGMYGKKLSRSRQVKTKYYFGHGLKAPSMNIMKISAPIISPL